MATKISLLMGRGGGFWTAGAIPHSGSDLALGRTLEFSSASRHAKVPSPLCSAGAVHKHNPPERSVGGWGAETGGVTSSAQRIPSLSGRNSPLKSRNMSLSP